jgi:small GTP-binding protein
MGIDNIHLKKSVVFKIIVSGDGGVGKSSFLNRLVNNDFNENNELTKGLDFFSKIIYANGTEYNFTMWDFAGQKQFKDILDNFVEGSMAAIILFDLSRFNTLETVFKWIFKLKQLGHIPILIIGTKMDLIDQNEIEIIDDYINQIVEENESIFDYIKISSKTGYNINQAFFKLINHISMKKS